MLKCQGVARHASEYLDHNADGRLRWQIRLHLLMCHKCRRFVRHLRITRQVVATRLRQQREEDHKLPTDISH